MKFKTTKIKECLQSSKIWMFLSTANSKKISEIPPSSGEEVQIKLSEPLSSKEKLDLYNKAISERYEELPTEVSDGFGEIARLYVTALAAGDLVSSEKYKDSHDRWRMVFEQKVIEDEIKRRNG